MIKNKNFFYLSILFVFSLMVSNYNSVVVNYFYNACFSIILFSSLITFLILFFEGNKIGFKGGYLLIFFSSILQILSFFTVFYNFVKNINNVMYSYNLGN